MSLLPLDLLQALQSPSNDVRAQAEEMLALWTNEKPDVLLMGLIEQIQSATDITVRSFDSCGELIVS